MHPQNVHVDFVIDPEGFAGDGVGLPGTTTDADQDAAILDLQV